MFVSHKDSNGQEHYFRFGSTNPDRLQRICRKMSRRTNRVIFATSPRERIRARIREAETIARYEGYCGVTVEQWDASSKQERFLL